MHPLMCVYKSLLVSILIATINALLLLPHIQLKKNQQRKCLKALFFSLFYMFNLISHCCCCCFFLLSAIDYCAVFVNFYLFTRKQMFAIPSSSFMFVVTLMNALHPKALMAFFAPTKPLNFFYEQRNNINACHYKLKYIRSTTTQNKTNSFQNIIPN